MCATTIFLKKIDFFFLLFFLGEWRISVEIEPGEVEDGSMFAGGGLIPTSVEAMARYVSVCC